MPRLFLSHSSKDNIPALAFQRWLVANGWSEEDIFIDLHDIDAGERWRDTLRKANASCEAVILLASPEALDSKECQREINLAEDLGKEIIVAILRDLHKDDPRLARWADRQFVDLTQQPTERMEPFERDGAVHRVEFHLPALASIAARLAHLGIAPGSFAWAPRPGEGPYPGLAAFDENDAGIFFGREAEIMAGMTRLRLMRKRRSPRLLVIQAASGAGKSSFLRAGLWPRLKRDPDFAPLAILRPALGIMTGPNGIGRQIAPYFAHYGKTKVPGDISRGLTNPAFAPGAALADLISQATALATTARRAGAPDARPPAPLIAIDQGEEMFAAENLQESQRFLELLAGLLKNPPPLPSGRAEHGAREQEWVDPYVLVTIRADSVEALLQRWPALGLEAPKTQVLPPLSPTAYRDVIVKPAEVYSERVRRLNVEPILVQKLVQDASGADALPLLAFTLEKLFHEFGADGNLTAKRYDAMGGIGGSIDRALGEAQKQAGAAGTAGHLRRLMVPGLATWDGSANAAKRLVANEAALLGSDPATPNGVRPLTRKIEIKKDESCEGSDPKSRAELAPLANALVANRLLTRGAGTLEVAHEALLRREPIAGWLEAQKDALKLRDNVLKEAKDWSDGGRHGESLVRRGARLESATSLLGRDDFASALAPAKDYLAACQKLETAGRRRARTTNAAIYTLLLGVIAGLGLVGFINQALLKEQYVWRMTMTPSVLTTAQEKEKAAKPGPDTKFAECKTGCPNMIVVPADKFMMGTAGEDAGSEGPQHEVAIAKPFAVSRTEVTFEQWDQCEAAGACPNASASGWGRGDRPVINVSWEEAKRYVDWLSRMTGKDYRLLTEAEWEYAARAGNPGKWSFGDDETQIGDYAWYSQNSESKTQPTAKKKPNAFGLYDTHGNVWEWVEDCYKGSYNDAPIDGSALASSNCSLRGGSWIDVPRLLRAAQRFNARPDFRRDILGFRLARTL